MKLVTGLYSSFIDKFVIEQAEVKRFVDSHLRGEGFETCADYLEARSSQQVHGQIAGSVVIDTKYTWLVHLLNFQT